MSARAILAFFCIPSPAVYDRTTFLRSSPTASGGRSEEGFFFMRLRLGTALVALALVGLNCNPAEPDAVVGDTGDGGPDVPHGLDTTPPTFAGAKKALALDEKTVQIAWDPATDDQTPAARILYRIYGGDTLETIDFTTPLATTPAGASSGQVSGLAGFHHYVFVVQALDAAGNQDGNTNAVAIDTPDHTAPSFGGVVLVSPTSSSSLHVAWNPAIDAGSTASQIRYTVYHTTTPGKEDFTAPTVVTSPGVTTADITGLTESTTYYVVVRAVDAAGNVALSTKELSATTLDVTAPTFAGITSLTSSGTTITANWALGSDTVSPVTDLVYTVYLGKSAGGEDFTKPHPIKNATSLTITGLDPSTKYFAVVRAKDGSGNEEKNGEERFATTAISADVTAPSFGGLASAVTSGKTTLDLAWSEAADDYSPAPNIVYDVYVSTTAGGEDFTTTARMPKGTSHYTVTGLTANTTYYCVVRARDEAGNRDTNKIEKFAKTLP